MLTAKRKAAFAEYASVVDLGAAIGDLAAGNRSMVGVMMRIGMAAISVALAGVFSLPAAGAGATSGPI